MGWFVEFAEDNDEFCWTAMLKDYIRGRFYACGWNVVQYAMLVITDCRQIAELQSKQAYRTPAMRPERLLPNAAALNEARECTGCQRFQYIPKDLHPQRAFLCICLPRPAMGPTVCILSIPVQASAACAAANSKTKPR